MPASLLTPLLLKAHLGGRPLGLVPLLSDTNEVLGTTDPEIGGIVRSLVGVMRDIVSHRVCWKRTASRTRSRPSACAPGCSCVCLQIRGLPLSIGSVECRSSVGFAGELVKVAQFHAGNPNAEVPAALALPEAGIWSRMIH